MGDDDARGGRGDPCPRGPISSSRANRGSPRAGLDRDRRFYAYAVRRFDLDPQRRTIHIEDLAQVRGFYPNRKYHGSFETVGALVYRQHDPEALREFTRRLTFNVLIGNGDAHLKNWSLIYHDRRNHTLAPAYDLVATFVYRPGTEGPEPNGVAFRGLEAFRGRAALRIRQAGRTGSGPRRSSPRSPKPSWRACARNGRARRPSSRASPSCVEESSISWRHVRTSCWVEFPLGWG